MLHRIPVAPILLAAALGLAWAAARAQDPAPAKGLLKPFTHEQHVSKSWSDAPGGEVLRDCRGCHDYRASDGKAKLDKPIDRCVKCHDPDLYWKDNGQKIVAEHPRVDPAAEEARLFKHRQHQLDEHQKPLACAFCHYEKSASGGWAIRTPADFLENKSYCTSCHDNKKPLEQWTPEEHAKRKVFNAGLTKEAKRRADDGGTPSRPVFSHAAHLRPEELQGGHPEKCAKCHASIQDSAPDSMAETQFDTSACERCHTGLTFQSTDKAVSGERFTVVSPTAGVFSHAQHLGKPSGKPGIQPIGPEGCLRCHEFETSPLRRAEDGVRSFTLKPFLARADGKAFQGCTVCHTELDIPDHGNVDACAQCHVVEPSSLTKQSAMKSNRPVDEIARAEPATFTFERQSHKFIAKGQTEDAPKSCADCHKAKLEEQPSRIDGRAFSHATHLNMSEVVNPASGAKAECGQCHAAIAGSRSLKDIELDFEPAACVACHGKTPPTPTLEPSPRKQVFRFDHLQHVGKRDAGGKLVACGTCHAQTGAQQESRIVLAEKIAECTLCHGHPEASDSRVNRFSKATVDSCKSCHAGGVPAKGVPVPVGRARLAVDRAGYQAHDGEARCETCHIVPEQPFAGSVRRAAAPRPIEVAVQAGSGMVESAHEARLALKKLPNGTPEQREAVQYFYDAVSCIDCHFHSARSALVKDAYVEAARKATTNARVKKILSDPRWRDNYRKHEFEGDNLGGPGTDYPSGYPGL